MTPRLLRAAPDSLVALTSLNGRRPGALWFPAVNLFWLAWMIGAPWIFGQGRPWVFVATYASVVVFLVLYQRAWFDSRRRLPAYTIAIAVLGLAIIPVNTSWSYIIYAGSLIPFCVRGWRAAGWLALLLGLFYAVAIASGYTPVLTLGCILTTSVVALLNGVYRMNLERDVELRLSQEEVRRLAVTAERERIGRDLHDLLGHTLSLVAIKSELARRLVDRDPAAAERELGEIERVARQALSEVREAVTGIRTTALAGELASARLMLETADIAFVVDGVAVDLDNDAEAALAMGLREAVTNVQRHARATRVDVQLAALDGRAQLIVRDDGRGGAHARGNGLAGMAERLAALGGTLDVVSEAGRGTEVRMNVPRRAGAAA